MYICTYIYIYGIRVNPMRDINASHLLKQGRIHTTVYSTHIAYVASPVAEPFVYMQ